ncbi:ABC transporter G family member 24-like isoform X2 [Juglans microcarpa x Juglans regia]|uniref:ABC transporter G family member 24-like isoform X2 n=1 Tax=Juglans microcarpa x Juglans regia TaxID=2249226 RepID=UPI001B7E960B|nr:ABC transporter G family member 24-like isoform X2 [Juglans microcarpa x Juglans regia]
MSFEKKFKTFTSWTTLILAVIILCLVQLVPCQDATGDTNQFDNPATLALITQVVYGQLSNLSAVIQKDVGNQSSFCIKDWDADWGRAFDFSSNLDFLSSCIQKTNGDITRRVCTAAEMKFYLNSFFEGPGSENYLKPNKNCNLTSWVSGCEPGWACSVNSNQQVNLNDAKVIPARTLNCQACCEGFFCPHGITCMIPCPLGSYCPLAKLNKTTGVCEPYLYQLPPGQPNHTCGGANIWADVGSSSELFCSAGSFCPTTTRRITCSKITAGWVLHPRKAASSCLHAIQTLRNKTCKHMELCFWERRLAKSREAAARSARETATARQKWKTAKDAAKKHASGLQAHLSRTFSRKKDFTHPEKLKILDQVKSDDDPIQQPSTSDSVAFLSSRVTSVEKKTEPSDLLRIMQEIEDDPDGCRGFNVGTGDKNMNVPVPKGKQTHTQIFRYAYSQLEKERAQQKENEKLTFSGIVKLATNTEIRKRPLLEISFKNLTLTLKAKNKHLLRCVTGEIKPGRITAVMGPSGAGKTIFLSAVAGKAIGCKMTGLILINGKNESIHSYKKIVGFVPQDDVVHGNLTVEENLWFSAKCRLSTDLSKPDKVLVVERVIEFLGLQTVRSSLVGTVEKRGISGGQRKRVNVGLEMVMEPSLLILDEPTSGLDSASSLQLLRALRREALEGVNICMVVHQPSYALFKMFDDLILLAKGGLTVYHGPVKKVEEYFAGLGINIPERMNPPDHFIDILEGIVVPGGSSRVSYKDLPVRWMHHNGYSIPLDMQQNNAALSRSSMDVILANETNPSGAGMEDHSFAREIWQGMKSNVVLQRDKLHLNFLKSKDLTNRRTPGAFQQYKYFLGRVGKQRLREARILAMDYLILLLAGACLGSLVKVKDQSFGADAYTYTIIAVSLLCKIAALRSFSLDKLHYWRESASGISSLAYFLSKDTIDHFNTVIKPAVYLSMFYFFTNPRSSFADNYIVLFCLVYCVTGIAHSLAIVFEPGTAQLCSVLLPVVLTLIATQPKDSEFMKILANLCYPKWALEAFVTANAERYYGVWLITRCGSLLKSGYNVHDWNLCIAILVSIGLVCRVIAFFCMLIFQKK